MNGCRKRSSAVVGVSLLIVAAISGPGIAGAADPPEIRRIGEPFVGTVGVRRTVTEIMAQEAASPSGPVEPMLMPELEFEEIFERPLNPASPRHVSSLPELPEGSVLRQGLGGRLEAFSPQTIGTNFTAATLSGTNPTGAFPPDCMGAVGPTQYVVMVNNRIVTFSKPTGVADGVMNTTTNTFFTSVRNGSGTSDPRIRYDRLSGRWFLLIINVSTPNRILLAVSDAASNGVISAGTVWTYFFLNIATTSPPISNTCLMDYPTLGIDANALYVGGNNFCGSPSQTFNSTDGWVIRKSSVLGAGPIVATVFRALISAGTPVPYQGPYTPQGVDNYDPASNEGFFIGVDGATYGTLMMRRISNPGFAPAISGNIAITVPATAAPLNSPHLGNTGGTTGNLDALDDRLFAAHIRNGRLWTAHNIGVDASGSGGGATTRTGTRWYELNVPPGSGTPTIVQSGTVFSNAASNPRYYSIPSVLVSGQGHAALGFTTAGAAERINAGTVGRLAADVFGTTETVTLATASSTAYNPPGDTGAGRGARRWGDYSYTSLDPFDDMTMWSVQEFCNASNSYGVRVFRLIAPPPATPSALVDVTAGQASVNLALTGVSASGSGFYDPGANLPGVPAFSHLAVTTSTGGATGTPPTVTSATYLNPTTINLVLNASAATPNIGAEKYTITVTNPDGQSAAAAILHVVSGNPVATLAPGASQSEGDAGTTSFLFTVNLSTTSPNTVTVNYQTSDGTATAADGDYAAATSFITIPPNTGNGTITVDVNGDVKRESNETFGVALTGATNATIGTPASATATIVNDDPVPSISIGDVTMTEGDAGTTAATFAVLLSNPRDQAVSVSWTTSDGTATLANGDYVGASEGATIPAGTLSTTIPIQVVGDTKLEGDETFVVDLSEPVNGTILDGQGVGTITNDDTAPTLSIDDPTVTEGDAGTAAVTFTVTPSNLSGSAVSVDYHTEDGSATEANGDYAGTSGTLVIPAKQASGTIEVTVNGDDTFEGNEAFTVVLENPIGASIADGTGAGTITNDDAAPALSIGDATVTEGDAGTTTATFTVTLSGLSGSVVSVEYHTEDGTATEANSDYVGASGTLMIPAKELSGTIEVTLNGDVTDEADETFTVVLENPIGASIADGTGTGTITNDDAAPALSIGDATVTEGDGGTTTATFTVTLSNPSTSAVSVDHHTEDGTATEANSDYQGASGTLVIPAKESSGTIQVTVNGDITFEANETFTVALTDPVGAALADASGTGTITNDDEGEAPLVHVDFPNDPDVVLVIGTSYVLRWTATDNVAVTSVDLLLSRDNGATFDPLALSESNDGEYEWAATPPPTAAALLRVVARDAAANTGHDVSDHPFEIQSPSAAPPFAAAMGYGLSPVRPNPSAIPITVDYMLPVAAAVRLSIVDLQGRERAVLVSGTVGSGRHRATWNTRDDRGPAPAGVYFVRYETPGKSFTQRFALVR